MKCSKCHFEIRNGECWCDGLDGSSSINFSMDFIEPHYNRALGKMIGSKREYRAELKERNLVEVGNEWKYVDQKRNREKQARKAEKDIESVRSDAYQMLNSYGE